MNKSKLYMIISIIMLVLTVSGSLAWYIWTSSNNKLISLGVCTPEIVFVGGETLNGEKIIPVLSKEEGVKKQIDVYLSKTCKSGDSSVMNLYMTLDLLPNSLKEESFVYEVWKDSTMLTRGNFQGKEQGSTIELLTNEIITENDSIYLVYIYIDGNLDNPISMSNSSFRFSVYGQGTGAIYKKNVIANPSTPSSSDSNFLNTSITRSSIQTITIAKDNTIPESGIIDTVDISSENDGSVLLWYTDTNEDGLYEVYMGSDSGKIEANTNGQGMFAYLTNVESLDLTNLDTSNITNMSSMFQGSSSLKEIKLSNFNTSKVTSMQSMFNGCSSLMSLDLSSFDTSKVTNMGSMFNGCNSLTSLELSNFNTNSLTMINNMFTNCSKLKEIDLSSFNTNNVKDMSKVFYGCNTLTKLDINNFETSNVTNMFGMFGGCSSLISLDLSNFDTSNVTNMGWMFSSCSNLIELDLSNFNTSNVTNMERIFYYCSSLEKLNINKFNMTNVTSSDSVMFWTVPTTVSITTNSTMASWLNENFPSYTNITIVDE